VSWDVRLQSNYQREMHCHGSIHGRNAILIDTKAKESERLPCAFPSKFHPRGDHSGRSYAKECDILKSTKPRPS
jgi:hypothetical protein